MPRTQLNTATATETIHKNNFDELKQSLTDEIKFANKAMDDAKKVLPRVLRSRRLRKVIWT